MTITDKNKILDHKEIYKLPKDQFKKELTKLFWEYYVNNEMLFIKITDMYFRKYKQYLTSAMYDNKQDLINQSIVDMFQNLFANKVSDKYPIQLKAMTNYTWVIKNSYKFALYKNVTKAQENDTRVTASFIKKKYRNWEVVDWDKIYWMDVTKIVASKSPSFVLFSEMDVKWADDGDMSLLDTLWVVDKEYENIETEHDLKIYKERLMNFFNGMLWTVMWYVYYTVFYNYFVDTWLNGRSNVHNSKVNYIKKILQQQDKKRSKWIYRTRLEIEMMIIEIANNVHKICEDVVKT